ncbi:MAG: hypothetical protein ACLPSW_03335 [Roseiarcus sp.]
MRGGASSRTAGEHAASHSPDVGSSRLFQIRAKLFQIFDLFLQGFPKIPSSVSWEINGLQGEKGKLLRSKFLAPSLRQSPAAGDAGMNEERQTKGYLYFRFSEM